MTQLRGLKVLIVEDEAAVAMLIEDMLEGLGCEVIASLASLAAARDVATNAEIDLAMLDVNVAGQLVFPVAELLDRRKIPFLFSTGYGVAGLPAEFRRHQVIAKPFSQAELHAKLVLALEG